MLFLGRANAQDSKWMLCFHVAQTGKHLLQTQNVSEQNQTHFLCPGRKFVSATNVAPGQTGEHLCRQQFVRNNVSSFARALRSGLSFKLTRHENGPFWKRSLNQKGIPVFCLAACLWRGVENGVNLHRKQRAHGKLNFYQCCSNLLFVSTKILLNKPIIFEHHNKRRLATRNVWVIVKSCEYTIGFANTAFINDHFQSTLNTSLNLNNKSLEGKTGEQPCNGLASHPLERRNTTYRCTKLGISAGFIWATGLTRDLLHYLKRALHILLSFHQIFVSTAG